MCDNAVELIESTANLMRGITLDPRIPDDTKEALRSRVAALEGFLSQMDDEED